MRVLRVMEGISTGSILLHARLADRPYYGIIYPILVIHWAASFLFHTTTHVCMYYMDLCMIDVMVNERLFYIFPYAPMGYCIYGGSIIMTTFLPTLLTDNRMYILPKIAIGFLAVAGSLAWHQGWMMGAQYLMVAILTGAFYGLANRYYDTAGILGHVCCILYHYLLGVVIYLEESHAVHDYAAYHDFDLLRWASWYCYMLALTTLCWRQYDDGRHACAPHVQDVQHDPDHDKKER